MSSIFGLMASGAEPARMTKAIEKMPEGLALRKGAPEAVWFAPEVCLGHSSWNKAAGAPLPAKTPCMLDGEIYNRNELFDALGLKEDPQTSDQALVLKLYERFGVDFPAKINGAFSIALYDQRKQKLLLVRDHLGARSLFYAKNKQGVFFASTIASLLATDCLDRTLSPDAMNTYLCSFSLCPPTTMYQAIRSLRPATLMVFDKDGKSLEHTYWRAGSIREERNRSMADFADELKYLLSDAVRKRASIGGQIGSIVSGGLDTSIITALLCDGLSSTSKTPALSITFDEKAFSDADLQNIMYQQYPLQPYRTTIDSSAYWQTLQNVVKNMDNPVNDVAAVGMYKVFELARETGCTAVFEGEAADELFFTNHIHGERQIQSLLKIVPGVVRKKILAQLFTTHPLGGGLGRKIRRLLFRLGLDDNSRRLFVLPSFLHSGLPILKPGTSGLSKDPLAVQRAYLEETCLGDPLNIYSYGLFKTFLPEDLLYKNERMASANQVFNRTPFADYRLAELSFKVPENMKVKPPTENDDGTKLVYKKAIQGLIPQHILLRKKNRGFSHPSDTWYQGDLKNNIEQLLIGKESPLNRHLDPRGINYVYQNHLTDQWFGYLINSLIILAFWLSNQKGI